MTQPDPTTAPELLPAFSHNFYGRLSEVCVDNEGFLVVGHDRRAWAALNAIHRDTLGAGRIDSREVERLWVRFSEVCGCTPEQHAEHEADDGCYGNDCTHPGLPPCTIDEYAWLTIRAEQTDTGAVPALEYRP